jgi:hypothetical protein
MITHNKNNDFEVYMRLALTKFTASLRTNYKNMGSNPCFHNEERFKEILFPPFP